MVKEQTIFLDCTPYNIQKESLIHKNTEILNLLIDDGTPQTECHLIGNRFEYKPAIWLEFQKERVVKLKKVNIIFLQSEFTDLLKSSIRNIFTSLDNIEFFNIYRTGNYKFFELAQRLAPIFLAENRENNCYFSIATMRLPRFFLTHWCQKNNVINFGYPKLSQDRLSRFTYELNTYQPVDTTDYQNVGRKFFGYIPQAEFEKKQIGLICNSRIAIVSHFFFHDYLTSFYDEKISLPIACKALPFFIDNISSNKNISKIGFKPYIGFDYSSDNVINVVSRWQTLLDSNKKFFINDRDSKHIYELNRNIIDHNYNVLMKTNWKAEAKKELLSLPEKIRNIILENTNFFR